jgi:hypothetical protein
MLTENQIVDQITKSTPLGLMIVLITNVACFAAGSALGKNNNPSSNSQLIAAILAVVAVGEIVMSIFIKKKMLEPLFAGDAQSNFNYVAQTMTKTTIVLSAMCAMAPIYGMVAVVLGAKSEYLAGFVIISLGGYLLLRLRPRDFKKLITQE